MPPNFTCEQGFALVAGGEEQSVFTIDPQWTPVKINAKLLKQESGLVDEQITDQLNDDPWYCWCGARCW